MNEVEAVRYLRDMARREPEVKWLIAGLCERIGAANLYEAAKAEPEVVAAYGDEVANMFDQQPPTTRA